MLKMVDGTGIIGVDMVCPLGGAASPPQPPNYDNVEMDGIGSLTLPNSLKAPLERLELIGNNTQGENPAPDNPQEIKSVGRKSKNLFDAKQLQGIPGFGVDGNEITQSAYNISTGKTLKQLCPEIIPGTYFLSTNNGEFSGLFGLTKPFYKNNVIEITEEDLNRIVSLVGASNKTIKFTLQLEKGDKKTDYEPYSDKHFVDLKVTGKNLFSGYLKDGYYNDSGILAPLRECKTTDFIPIKNVVCTSFTSISERGFRIAEFDANKNFIKRKTTIKNKEVLLLDKNTRYIAASVNYEYYKNIMLEQKDEPTPYEPYTEQSVQIALGEPLRGIGEYKDTITKDGVVRKIKRTVFDGSEDEKWGLSREHENHINFALVIKGAITVNTGIRTMMDKFKYFGAIWNSDLLGQDMFGATLRINMPKTLATDLQTFKTWLSQNPLTVDYVLAESVTEPLPESVQAQLSSLHSENGTTHINIDSGEVEAGIKLTYRKEK